MRSAEDRAGVTPAPQFELPAFRPHPLVRGGHLQTIMSAYLPSRARLQPTLHQVTLPDGDAIALHDDGVGGDFSPATNGSLPAGTPPHVVVLLHGLGGSYLSGYMLRCSAKLRAAGCHVFRMDLRGCGAGIHLSRHPLHAGRSEDAAAVLDFVSRRCPGSPIHIVGFSMGANIALKLAGEVGEAAPPHLASVLAVSPPIDLVECTRNIQRGLSRVYDRRFVRSLVKHTRHRLKHMPTALTRPLLPCPRRLMDFDSVFTAPLSGFADVHDYYDRASSSRVLQNIAVPTLIVTAASDPIVPVAAFERAKYSTTTQLVITSCGGHLGFIAARSRDPDYRWLDWRVVDWITSRADNHSHQLAPMPRIGP